MFSVWSKNIYKTCSNCEGGISSSILNVYGGYCNKRYWQLGKFFCSEPLPFSNKWINSKAKTKMRGFENTGMISLDNKNNINTVPI